MDRSLTVLTYQHRDSGTVYGRFMEEATGLVPSMQYNAPGELWAAHPSEAAGRVSGYERVRRDFPIT